MRENMILHMKRMLQEQKKWKRWQKAVVTMAAVVVFCTTYALILPAITMGAKTYCGMEEHHHDEGCYVLRRRGVATPGNAILEELGYENLATPGDAALEELGYGDLATPGDADLEEPGYGNLATPGDAVPEESGYENLATPGDAGEALGEREGSATSGDAGLPGTTWENWQHTENFLRDPEGTERAEETVATPGNADRKEAGKNQEILAGTKRAGSGRQTGLLERELLAGSGEATPSNGWAAETATQSNALQGELTGGKKKTSKKRQKREEDEEDDWDDGWDDEEDTDVEGNRFFYQVDSVEILKKTEVEQMEAGDWDLTLFTCTYGGQTRFTLRCVLEEDL